MTNSNLRIKRLVEDMCHQLGVTLNPRAASRFEAIIQSVVVTLSINEADTHVSIPRNAYTLFDESVFSDKEFMRFEIMSKISDFQKYKDRQQMLNELCYMLAITYS